MVKQGANKVTSYGLEALQLHTAEARCLPSTVWFQNTFKMDTFSDYQPVRTVRIAIEQVLPPLSFHSLKLKRQTARWLVS